jgi:predicted regulator of Ras-like GTPase activity (Roadblock/LC7/MglB family)
MTQQRLMLVLRTLRDVPGVLGSFVWRRDGLVIASDVPPACTPSSLAAVAVRLQRLCESFTNLGEPFHGVSLSYPDHELQVSSVQWAALAVLLSAQTNRSVLQLVLEPCLQDLRQLGAAMTTSASAGPLRPRAGTPPPAPRRDESRVSGVHTRVGESAAPPASSEHTVRSYRGQRIGE